MRNPALVDFSFFVPPFRHTQGEVVDAAARTLNWDDVTRARVARLFARAGVQVRHSVAPLDVIFGSTPFDARNQSSAEALVRGATEMTHHLMSAHAVRPDALISASCTAYMIPSIEARVASALNIEGPLVRLPITQSGCAGGAVALARSSDFLRATPSAAATVTAIESCSLTFRPSDRSPTNKVAIALFGDGGASALLAGAEHPLAQAGILEFLGARSYFFTQSLDMMGFELRHDGLELVLNRRLPAFLSGRLTPALAEFLSSFDLTQASVDGWAIHPGGRAILDGVQQELGLDESAMEASRQTLRDFGNMSSATILFVLRRAAQQAASGSHVVSIGFGPGFGAELALWRRTAVAMGNEERSK